MSEVGLPDSSETEAWPDEFDDYLADALRDPEFAAAYAEAGRRFDRQHPGFKRPVAVKPALSGRRHAW